MIFGGRKSLPVCAYGKLPLSREFLSIACKEKSARAYSDFLHQIARHSSEMELGRDDAFRLYIPVDRGRSLIASSLWPSSDEGGLRRFPFSFFAICPMKRVPATQPGLCTAFTAIHARHEAAYRETRALSDARAFERHLVEKLAETDLPLDADAAAAAYREQARTYVTTQWAAALYGEQAHNFLVVLWRIARLVEASRGSFAALGNDHAGLRVPLVASHSLETQADAWLGMLAGGGRLSCAPNILVGRFGPDDTASLCLFFRPLQPADLAIVSGGTVRGLFDLSQHKEPADMDGFNRFAERMQTLLGGSHATLAELPTILEAV